MKKSELKELQGSFRNIAATLDSINSRLGEITNSRSKKPKTTKFKTMRASNLENLAEMVNEFIKRNGVKIVDWNCGDDRILIEYQREDIPVDPGLGFFYPQAHQRRTF